MSSWSTSVVPALVGLAQLGNSCFLNSIVQSLYLTDDFRAALTSLHLSPAEMKRFGTLRSLQHLFALLAYCTRPSYSPKAFRAAMPEQFRNGSQQDADEFAKYLLETLHNHWKELTSTRQQQQQQGAAAGKRKADGTDVDDQREQKVAAIADHSASSSPAPAGAAAAASTHDTAMSDAVAVERPQSQHGQIRGGGESLSASPVSVAVRGAVVRSALKPERVRAELMQRASPPLHTASPPVASSLSSSASVSGARSPSPSAAASPISPSSPSPQHDIDPQFGGIISSCITCLRCGHASVKEEAFLELPLPMQQMDAQQRAQLHERIQQAKARAQAGDQLDVQDTEQRRHEQSSAAVLVKTDSVTSEPAPAPPTRSSPVASAAAKALPTDVLSRILAFASPGSAPALNKGSTPQSTPTPPAGTSALAVTDDVVMSVKALLDLRGLQSASASSSSAAPSTVSSHSASASVPASSSTAVLPVLRSPASPVAVSASAPSALLAAFLAQAVLHTTMQAMLLTTVSTLTTAATLAQQQRQQDLVHESRTGEQSGGSSEEKEDKSTALVLYVPPPGPSTVAALPTADSSSSSTSSPSSSASAASSQLSSSSLSTSSSPASPPSLLSLTSMLDLYLSPELLVGDNAYHCSRCASKQSATLSCTISSPPPHLLIALKRNEYDARLQYRTKIMTEVHFPAFLHLPSSSSSASSSPTAPGASYALYSVVVHSGLSADSGHYYTIGRRSGELRRRMHAKLVEGRAMTDDDSRDAEAAEREALEEAARGGRDEFFHFNDETVTSSSFTSIRQVTKHQVQDVAYLLFYVRVDGDEVQAKLDAPPITENPLLQRLAELEGATFLRQREKETREAAKKAAELLVGVRASVPAYVPPPDEWTDPDQ